MLAKILLLVVGVGSVASAGSNHIEELTEKEKSVQGLNVWLVYNVPGNSTDPEVNLREAPKAVEADPSLKPAVDALQLIATTNGCDANVREALRLYLSVDLEKGLRRIETVAKRYIPKVPAEACFDSFERDFAAAAPLSEPTISALAAQFRQDRMEVMRNMGQYVVDKYLSSPSPYDLSENELLHFSTFASIVKKLAKNDPKAKVIERTLNKETGKFETKFFPENYRYAFETYLLKPCQQYTENTARLMESFFPIAKFLTNPNDLEKYKSKWHYSTIFEGPDGINGRVKTHQYASYFLSDEIRDALLTYKRCQLIESYDEQTVNRAFRLASAF